MPLPVDPVEVGAGVGDPILQPIAGGNFGDGRGATAKLKGGKVENWFCLIKEHLVAL